MKMTATQLLKSVNNKKHILIDLDTSSPSINLFEGQREIWIWLSYSQMDSLGPFDSWFSPSDMLLDPQNLDKGKITHFKRQRIHPVGSRFCQALWEKENYENDQQ